LRSFVDRELANIAEAVGAEAWHVPAIGRMEDVIVPTRYLASHAQYVTFGYQLPCHFETLQRVSKNVREGMIEGPRADDLVDAGFMLEPFACHNMFRMLKGKRVDACRTITALGRCFRHEGFRFEPMLRQWEFSVREIVLVGSANEIATRRMELVELAQGLARHLDVDARLAIATDPFFVSEAASQRTFQAMNSTKLEFELALDETRRTASGSFNLHGKHFSEVLGITDATQTPVDTACVGFGLERWMAAVVARWGADPGGWPI